MSDCGCGCQDCTDAMNWHLDIALASKLCAKAGHIGTFELTVSKGGEVSGNLYASIVRDNQGIPSTNPEDVLFKSGPQPIGNIQGVLVDNTLSIPVGVSVDPKEACHVVIEADDEYRQSVRNNNITVFVKCTAQTTSPCVRQRNGWVNTSIGPIVKVTTGE